MTDDTLFVVRHDGGSVDVYADRDDMEKCVKRLALRHGCIKDVGKKIAECIECGTDVLVDQVPQLLIALGNNHRFGSRRAYCRYIHVLFRPKGKEVKP